MILSTLLDAPPFFFPQPPPVPLKKQHRPFFPLAVGGGRRAPSPIRDTRHVWTVVPASPFFALCCFVDAWCFSFRLFLPLHAARAPSTSSLLLFSLHFFTQLPFLAAIHLSNPQKPTPHPHNTHVFLGDDATHRTTTTDVWRERRVRFSTPHAFVTAAPRRAPHAAGAHNR